MIAFDDQLHAAATARPRPPRLFEIAAELISDSPPPERVWHRIFSAIEKR